MKVVQCKATMVYGSDPLLLTYTSAQQPYYGLHVIIASRNNINEGGGINYRYRFADDAQKLLQRVENL